MSIPQSMIRSISDIVKPCNTKGLMPGSRLKLLKEIWPDCPEEVKTLLFQSGFMSEPASTKYHGNYAGGLFDHSVNVARVLRFLTDKGICEAWHRSNSPELVGLLHDFTKVGRYAWDAVSSMYTYKKDRLDFGGHGSDSVIKLQQCLSLTQEEILCIRYHMGAYEKDDWEGFDQAIRMYPNVLWTHTADMYASKLLETTV